MDFIFTVEEFPSPDAMVFAKGEPMLVPGGSTANIAVGLSRLGVGSRFVGKVGADENGLTLKTAFEKDGVDTSWLVFDPAGRTAQTIIVVDGQGRRIIYSLGGTALLETPHELDPSAIEGTDLLYIGEAFPDVARRAAALARERGARVVCGPGGTASWVPIHALMELLREADYVLLSRGELMSLMSSAGARSSGDHRDGATWLLCNGIRNAVVTLGQGGAVCYSSGGTCPTADGAPVGVTGTSVAQACFRVQAVDTTGAGDAFSAGFMSALLDGLPTAECLRRGNACAALAIQRVGAREAMPTRGELDEFLEGSTAS
jgi:sugar/nucleoside kinase (ribokinase family)